MPSHGSCVFCLQCPGQCITKLLTKGTYAAPNRDPGTHAAISTLAHELTETATNPTGKSWVNAKGRENADICSWRFGYGREPLQR